MKSQIQRWSFVFFTLFVFNAIGAQWITIPSGLEGDTEWADTRGAIVCSGLGIPYNKPGGTEWNSWIDDYVEKAKVKAQEGVADAQFVLGNCYNNVFRRTGEFAYDKKKANEYYLLASKQGHPGAIKKLAEAEDIKNRVILIQCNQVGVSTNKPPSISWDDWIRKGLEELKFMASEGDAEAQYKLGYCYQEGHAGIGVDYGEAVKWFSLAAEANHFSAQLVLGDCYANGRGVSKNISYAAKLYRLSAEGDNAFAQCELAKCYATGKGVIEDYVEAYAWFLLAAKNQDLFAFDRDGFKRSLQQAQIASGQHRAKELQSEIERKKAISESDTGQVLSSEISPSGYGSGLLVKGGFILTCWHVVDGAERISIVVNGNDYIATIVQHDEANDIAVLQTPSITSAPALNYSDDAKLGEKVFTLGFPLPDLQGTDVKFTTGTISSLTGIRNSPRYYQISAPLQPGNSGGALFNEKGNLIGIVAAKLDSIATLSITGDLPQNVNYAVKAGYAIPLLKTIEGFEIDSKRNDEVSLLDLIEELKQSVVMIKVY